MPFSHTRLPHCGEDLLAASAIIPAERIQQCIYVIRGQELEITNCDIKHDEQIRQLFLILRQMLEPPKEPQAKFGFHGRKRD